MIPGKSCILWLLFIFESHCSLGGTGGHYLKRLQDEVFNATIESPVALLFVDGSVSLIESSMEPRLLQELIFNPTM